MLPLLLRRRLFIDVAILCCGFKKLNALRHGRRHDHAGYVDVILVLLLHHLVVLPPLIFVALSLSLHCHCHQGLAVGAPAAKASFSPYIWVNEGGSK